MIINFYFLNLLLLISFFNPLISILFIVVLLTFKTWFHSENWNNFNLKVNKLKAIEIIFLLSMLIILFLLLSIKININWIIFILEIQTFIVFGSCFILSENDIKIKTVEGGLNYIPVAFISFIVFLLFIITLLIIKNESYNIEYLISMIILISISIKLGVFPFQIWVPNVIEKLSYSSIILVSILGKIFIIIVIVFYININSKLTLINGFISVLIASMFMVNQIQIKNFIAYSGIANIGWILIVISLIEMNENLSNKNLDVLFIFFFLYATSFILLIINLIKSKGNHIYKLYKKINGDKRTLLLYIGILIALISMAGIPPLAGFIGKFIVIKFIIENNISISIVIIAITLLFTFCYTRPIILLFKGNKINNLFLHEKIIFNNKKITLYKPWIEWSNLIGISFIITYIYV